MAVFYCQFDVLRIVIAPADDDQVFETARHKESAVVQKAQVSGTQERTLTGSGIGVEGTVCLLRFLPVSSGSARAGCPDFSDFVIRAWHQGFRMDDQDFLLL